MDKKIVLMIIFFGLTNLSSIANCVTGYTCSIKDLNNNTISSQDKKVTTIKELSSENQNIKNQKEKKDIKKITENKKEDKK